jgi:uncharacterized membrane protein YfhO
VETRSSAPGYLVLVEAYDPGWRASVDGSPAEVRRANVGFRAVAVPGGTHRVVFVYRPRAALVGLAASIVTLVVCAFALGRQRGTSVAGSVRP